MKLRIERAIRLGHQPGAPIGVLFANHFDFGTPAPARPMIIPLNLILGDIAEDAGADQVARGKLIRFASLWRTNRGDQIPCNYGIACRLDLFENVAQGFFTVGVFPRLCRQLRSEEHTSELQSLAYLV